MAPFDSINPVSASAGLAALGEIGLAGVMTSQFGAEHTSKLPLQRTLRGVAECSGVGVHSGNKMTLRLCPAEPNTGITFFRTDLKNGARTIKATWDNVIDTRLCTVLGNTHGGKVGTVEHLMAAIRAAGIDNALIEIDGPEVPIMDGSANPFVFLIEMAGVVEQSTPRNEIVILKPVEVRDGNRFARLLPSDDIRFDMHIDFASNVIRNQKYSFDLSADAFKAEVGRARTFGFFEEGEQLRKLGLGRGCSLDNTVVIKDNAIMNEDGLRYSNEFVRHKLLDAVGDIALAGAPIRGLFQGHCTGHAMNNRLLHALFAQQDAWSLKSDESAEFAPIIQQNHN